MQSVDYEASRVSQADEERIGCKESFKAAQMVIFVGRVRRALHSVWAEERGETSRSIMSDGDDDVFQQYVRTRAPPCRSPVTDWLM